MTTYGNLEPGNYYLIQESEHSLVELVFVTMTTEQAVMLDYEDAEKTRLWFKKADPLHEIVEKFSAETRAAYEMIAAASTESVWEEEEMDPGTEDMWNEEEDDLDFPYKN